MASVIPIPTIPSSLDDATYVHELNEATGISRSSLRIANKVLEQLRKEYYDSLISEISTIPGVGSITPLGTVAELLDLPANTNVLGSIRVLHIDPNAPQEQISALRDIYKIEYREDFAIIKYLIHRLNKAQSRIYEMMHSLTTTRVVSARPWEFKEICVAAANSDIANIFTIDLSKGNGSLYQAETREEPIQVALMREIMELSKNKNPVYLLTNPTKISPLKMLKRFIENHYIDIAQEYYCDREDAEAGAKSLKESLVISAYLSKS